MVKILDLTPSPSDTNTSSNNTPPDTSTANNNLSRVRYRDVVSFVGFTAISTLIVQPLEVARHLSITHPLRLHTARRRSAFHLVRSLYRLVGFRGLLIMNWRSASVATFSDSLAYGSFRLITHYSPPGVLFRLGAGISAGIFSSLLSHPFEFSAAHVGRVVHGRHCRNFRNVLRTILQVEGVRGLYSHFPTALLHSLVYRTLYFGLGSQFLVSSLQGTIQLCDFGFFARSFFEILGEFPLALSSVVLAYPLDVMKNRLIFSHAIGRRTLFLRLCRDGNLYAGLPVSMSTALLLVLCVGTLDKFNNLIERSVSIRNPPIWYAGGQLKRSDLYEMRKEFWETRSAGNPEVWVLLRRATCSSSLTASVLLYEGGLTLPHGDLTFAVGRDGFEYELPPFVLSDPADVDFELDHDYWFEFESLFRG